MITAEFDYRKPESLRDLFEIVGNCPGQVKFLSGGMTLVPMLNLGLTAPEMLVSLRAIPELTQVTEETDALVLGAMTRHYIVASSPLIAKHAPLLQMAAKLIGDVQVRNRGTLGGSLAHADPAANYLPAVLALDAQFELASARGMRRVAANAFFQDVMTTALDDDEIILSVRIPKGAEKRFCGFQKFTRVKGNFPIVCAAAVLDTQGAGKLVVGGITSIPAAISVAAAGGDSGSNALAESIRAAIGEPIEDHNGDAEYKREMAVVFGMRAVADARRNAVNAGAANVQ